MPPSNQQSDPKVESIQKAMPSSLPDEVLLNILKFLGFREWLTLAKCVDTKSDMLSLISDSSLWCRYYPNIPQDDEAYTNHQLCIKANTL